MPALSIPEIQTLLRQNKLPIEYAIQAPVTISSADVINTIKLFNDNVCLKNFIELLSTNPDVTIRVNQQDIRQGTAAKFVHAYTEHGLMPNELDETKQNEVLSHLKEFRFELKQLYYLLKNLSHQAINEYLLKNNCFSKDDLLSVCSSLDSLKKIPSCIVKSLYHIFNRTRRWKESETPFLDMFYFAYRAGHVLGLDGPITVTQGLTEYNLETEYAPAETSLRLLFEFIESYSQRYPSDEFEAIKVAVKANLLQLSKNSLRYKHDAHVEISKQYHRGELTFLSCSWTGHTVALALYGDYLIYTNRGEGCDATAGSKIFKLKSNAIINQPLLHRLLNTYTVNEFHDVLGELIDFKKPVVRFRSKPQKYGNCTFVNPKSSIEPMLVLLQAGPKATEENLKKIATLERRRVKYKRFTSFIRNREIDELVKNMFYARNDLLIQFYTKLVEKIIITHHGGKKATIKDRQERQRALDLFQRTPDKIQSRLQNNLELMKIINEIKNENIESSRAHYRWDTYLPVRNIRKNETLKVSIEQGYITGINGVATPKTWYSLGNVRKLSNAILKRQ